MSQPIPTSEVLNRAADLIEERGWGHGVESMLGRDGVCLMGAIHAATFGRFEEDYRASALCPAGRAIYSHLALDPGNVDAGWEWNDQWFTFSLETRSWSVDSPSKAIEVLRATAVIAAAREEQDAAFATYAVSEVS